jgi:hypothetical protein
MKCIKEIQTLELVIFISVCPVEAIMGEYISWFSKEEFAIKNEPNPRMKKKEDNRAYATVG